MPKLYTTRLHVRASQSSLAKKKEKNGIVFFMTHLHGLRQTEDGRQRTLRIQNKQAVGQNGETEQTDIMLLGNMYSFRKCGIL